MGGGDPQMGCCRLGAAPPRWGGSFWRLAGLHRRKPAADFFVMAFLLLRFAGAFALPPRGRCWCTSSGPACRGGMARKRPAAAIRSSRELVLLEEAARSVTASCPRRPCLRNTCSRDQVIQKVPYT